MVNFLVIPNILQYFSKSPLFLHATHNSEILVVKQIFLSAVHILSNDVLVVFCDSPAGHYQWGIQSVVALGE